MGRAPCCEKIGIKKGRWTTEEDQILSNYIQTNGEGSWRSLPKNAGLKRCGKSCRLRWINYLRSDLKRGNITPDEEELVVKLHATLGNRWSVIASHLPGRTDNEIKNYWNSHLSRKLHNFIRKPSISHGVSAVIMNVPQEAARPHAKRRPGRTSRSAMKPKTHNVPKARKMKKKIAPVPEPNVEAAVKLVAEEETLMMELSGAEADQLGPCDYYGDYCENNLMSINDDNGVLTFDDDILNLLLNGSDPENAFTSCGGDANTKDSETAGGFSGTSNRGENHDCLQSCPSVESFLNCETSVEFLDWQEGNNSNLWNEKEGPDSMVAWLLDGDDETAIENSNCENFGEPLDLDEEDPLVAWLLS